MSCWNRGSCRRFGRRVPAKLCVRKGTSQQRWQSSRTSHIGRRGLSRQDGNCVTGQTNCLSKNVLVDGIHLLVDNKQFILIIILVGKHRYSSQDGFNGLTILSANQPPSPSYTHWTWTVSAVVSTYSRVPF